MASREVVWPLSLTGLFYFFNRLNHQTMFIFDFLKRRWFDLTTWNAGVFLTGSGMLSDQSNETRESCQFPHFFVWQPAWKEDKFKQTNGRWSDSQKCNWEGGQGDPKNHQLGLFFIQRWFDDFSYAAFPPTVLVGLCVCAILFFGRRFYLRWYCLRWRWSDPFNHCFTKRKYLFWMDLLMDLP